MRASPPISRPSPRMGIEKPQLTKLQQKRLEHNEEESQPLSDHTSIFHSISEIKRQHTSGISHDGEDQARETVAQLIKGTEKIGDLIEDGTTTLVFREVQIDTSLLSNVYNHRYIVYQKENSEGQIKIRSAEQQNRKSSAQQSENKDQTPFTFHQCTFFFCDTRDNKLANNLYLLVGMKIATDIPIRFVDCAFIGLNFTSIGSKTSGVDFMVFTDCFSKIHLELINCYFSGTRAVLYTNFPVKALTVRQCTFDQINSDCMHITHPDECHISLCQFFTCSSQPINLKLFDEEVPMNPHKKSSTFATTFKENSIVGQILTQRNTNLLEDSSRNRKLSQRHSDTPSKKKRIKIKENLFSNCENCIKIKGMKKFANSLDELDIIIDDNNFETIKSSSIFLENVHAGRLFVRRNSIIKCSSTAIKVFNCRASKEEIQFLKNSLNVVYNIGICVDSSSVVMLNNDLISCHGGILLYLNSAASGNRDDVFDSHKDIILRDTIKDSFIAGGSNNTHLVGNMSLLGGENYSSNAVPNTCRVVLRANHFKEISQYGILVQNCTSSSLKIEDCTFNSVKEPLVINEKEIILSRNNTRNFLPGDNSEMLAPSFCATPRQLSPSGKGTIVIKGNRFEGSPLSIVKKHLNSNLYDIGNSHQP